LAKAEGEWEEASAASSSNVVTCNAVLVDNGVAGSDSEEVFTTKEQEDLLADGDQKGEQVEVNMNLRGGKVLPDCRCFGPATYYGEYPK
jgi:hypothetical protein